MMLQQTTEEVCSQRLPYLRGRRPLRREGGGGGGKILAQACAGSEVKWPCYESKDNHR